MSHRSKNAALFIVILNTDKNLHQFFLSAPIKLWPTIFCVVDSFGLQVFIRNSTFNKIHGIDNCADIGLQIR